MNETDPELQRFTAVTDHNTLVSYGIFEKPIDYPHHFAVRQFYTVRGDTFVHTGEVKLADTLEEARELIPLFLYPIPRQPTDPAYLVETWI
jgi:hypothetical protein